MENQSLKEKTAKGLFWGGLSNTVFQLLSLLFGVVLARLLTPADYGMIGMLAVFPAVANSMQESGFTAALTNKSEIRHEDYNAVFWFSLGMGTMLYAILFFCAPLIADFFHTPALTPLSRFLFLGFLISSTGTAHNAYLFKTMRVKQKAKAMIAAITTSGIVGVAMAYYGWAYWGLATQSVAYILIYNLMVWHYSPWRPTLHIDFKPIAEMFPFSVKLLITNIFHYINENIISLILGRCYNKQDVGYYAQANKWTNMGQTTITGIINGVAQPVLVEVADDAERKVKVFRKILRFTAFIAFPAMLGLALIAPEFIVIAITEKWMMSASIMQILCIWGAFMPIKALYTNLIISKGHSDLYMWNTIVLNLVQLGALLMAIPYGIYAMAALFVAINIVWLLAWHYFAARHSTLRLIDALKDIMPYLLVSCVSLATAWFAMRQVDNVYLSLIGKIAIAAVCYLSILWLANSVILRESLSFLLKRKL